MEEDQTQIRDAAARVAVVDQTVAKGTANISNETKKEVSRRRRGSGMSRSSQVSTTNTKTGGLRRLS